MSILGNNSVLGTEFKLNVNMTPMSGYNMASIDWEVKVFTEGNPNKSIVIKKDDAVKVDDDNYLVVVDSAVLGAGRYYMTLTAHFPDADSPRGERIEKRSCFTGVTIDAR